jgi:hypothetical protein
MGVKGVFVIPINVNAIDKVAANKNAKRVSTFCT